MTKKDFKTGVNPATMFINVAEPEAPAVKPEPKKQAVKPATKKAEPVKQEKTKAETKSKRLNLLLQPSLLEDLSKIATMNKDSVNNLINSALIDYRDAHKDIIAKYNSVFEG